MNVSALQRAGVPPRPVFDVLVARWSCFITCFLTSVVAPPRIILNDESLTLFEVRTQHMCSDSLWFVLPLTLPQASVTFKISCIML